MLTSFLTRFAAESSPSIHITPETLTHVNGWPITNSMVYGWISAAVIVLVLIATARFMRVRPRKGLVQLVEIGAEFITNLLAASLGDRKKAVKYAPYFVTIFMFLVLSNWLGLLPGVGETFTYHGTPLLRPFTADINGTLAAAVVTMIFVQTFAIKESGFFNHLKHYFNGSFLNPMTWFLGIFEMFGELTRIGSLALRLFLNVAIGEVIIAVFSWLGSLAAPVTSLPFVILELLVGALQAYIFVMLSVMYLAVAVKHHEQHAAEAHDHVPAGTETGGAMDVH